MPRVLIKYGKTGPLKYLSHLELIRAIERSFRRAGIEVARSGGFNPRPKMSHGPALPVGVASTAEYMTADLQEEVPETELLKKLSSVLPEGLRVFGAKYIEGGQPSITSVVQSAAYCVRVDACPDDDSVSTSIKRLLSEDRLLVRHKDKEKWVETNKAVLGWKSEREGNNGYIFYMLLSLGDQNSVRPEILLEKLAGVLHSPCGFTVREICRSELYVNRDIPLHDIYTFYESVKMGSGNTSS